MVLKDRVIKSVRPIDRNARSVNSPANEITTSAYSGFMAGESKAYDAICGF